MSLIREMRTQFLLTNGYTFETKNNGEHLVILTPAGKVDYWPSSGKYHDHTTGVRGASIEEFHALINARRNCEEVAVRGRDIPVVNTIDPRDQRIAELEAVISKAIDEWVASSTNALSSIMVKELNAVLVNKKATAHNSSSKLPWE